MQSLYCDAKQVGKYMCTSLPCAGELCGGSGFVSILSG